MKKNRNLFSKTAMRQLFGYGILVLILAGLPFGIKFDSSGKLFDGESTKVPREIVELTALIQQASRSTYGDKDLDTTEQLRYFIPAWEFVYKNDLPITRIFPKFLDGKLEPGDKKTWPGWAFYFQTKSKQGDEYCIADTRTLVVPDITLEQDLRHRQPNAQIEMVSKPGNCRKYIDRYSQAIDQTSK